MTDRAYVSGYDPMLAEIMRKTYAHDPEIGDPVVTLGMAPRRVREMPANEREYNWGAYYHDEDMIDLNPDIPKRDRTDTARHEFRHRGARILDDKAGREQAFNLEELAMLMTDMSREIGTDDYNVGSIQYMAEDYAKEHGMPFGAALAEADNLAALMNSEARGVLGGGAKYASPLERLVELMMAGGTQ